MRLFFLWNILLCILSAEIPAKSDIECWKVIGSVTKVHVKCNMELPPDQPLVLRVYCPLNEETVLVLGEVDMKGSNEVSFTASPGWRFHANRPVFLSVQDESGKHLCTSDFVVFVDLPTIAD